MIIAFSGWRGIPRNFDNQMEIRDAAAETLCDLFVAHPDARYRVGDNPAGWDESIRKLWLTQRNRNGWYHPQLWGRRSLDRTWVAEWSKLGLRAGPERSRAMLRGDGSGDPVDGFADLLVALPQPGVRRQGSGTWAAIDIAAELEIPTMIIPLRPARRSFDRGARRLSILPA